MDNMMDLLRQRAEFMVIAKILERTRQPQAHSPLSKDSPSDKWQLSRQASILVSLAIMIIIGSVFAYHYFFH
ncbi:hypothetical protein KDA_53040 [Dictyobacter alpinus]|uniref:Uncharacterized protein n=1 Tax=Dictyobacter alpinus TaxID=2014873 RepID=A0A402BEU7_9CHLR|nr:hypothetical protein [Dictyobacter alpinus]GCE29820.1 hypothetical protein KDA_53040 [Dictyobacter alpinus]